MQSAELAQIDRVEGAELVTFHVGDLLLGAWIDHVEEINRHVDVTPVPHAPASVRGVINLRGEVVTILDLRTILGLERAEVSKRTRNLVVTAAHERVGLLVDRIADVVRARPDDIAPPPANVGGAEGRFFKGVLQMEGGLLVVLDVDAVLSAAADAAGDRRNTCQSERHSMGDLR